MSINNENLNLLPTRHNSTHIDNFQIPYEESILYVHRYYQLRTDFNGLKLSLINYKQQANFWKAKHGEAVRREETLKKEIDKLSAELKKTKHKLFGKSSEKNKNKNHPEINENKVSSTDENKRKRGQQSNNKGPSRRDYSHLPSVVEEIDLPEDERSCHECGLPHEKLPGCAESDIVEVIDVKAHVRKIRRAMYKRHKSCQCRNLPELITAPPAPRVVPKTRYGVSIWAKVLLEKFCYQRPIHRLLKFLTHQGLNLSSGTITSGLKKIMPLFLPIYDALQQKSVTENHWHADETRWEVYEQIENKAGSRWYLWIFRSKHVVIIKVAPSRSAKTPGDHFKDVKEGILSVDRYSAYKAVAKNGLLILAFCWAHVRRDFFDYAKAYPKDEAWAFDWVDEIANLYHINNQRIAAPEGSEIFEKLNVELKKAVGKIQKKYRTQLEENTLPKEAIKILISLDNHWEGLIVFIEYSFVPMDNNKAENGLRPGVLARNAFFGSHAVWSAYLLVMMLSINQTAALWGINPHAWIESYLHACAKNEGNPPDDLKPFLPWEMSKQRLKLLQQPVPHQDTS
jgi:transposase